jgi:hypothetical protein
LSESYKEETTRLYKSVKMDIVEEASSKVHKYGTRTKKPKLSIDLNKPALEEDQDEHMVETKDAQGKQSTEEFQIVIKYLKQENQTFETWNAKLQEIVQKMKENLKTQHGLSKKVRKMNIKLYWSNVVLKTKL